MTFQPTVHDDFFVTCDGTSGGHACDAYLGHDDDPRLPQFLQEPRLPKAWAAPGRRPGDWLLTPIRHLCPLCADAEGRRLLTDNLHPTSEETP